MSAKRYDKSLIKYGVKKAMEFGMHVSTPKVINIGLVIFLKKFLVVLMVPEFIIIKSLSC